MVVLIIKMASEVDNDHLTRIICCWLFPDKHSPQIHSGNFSNPGRDIQGHSPHTLTTCIRYLESWRHGSSLPFWASNNVDTANQISISHNMKTWIVCPIQQDSIRNMKKLKWTSCAPLGGQKTGIIRRALKPSRVSLRGNNVDHIGSPIIARMIELSTEHEVAILIVYAFGTATNRRFKSSRSTDFEQLGVF